MGTFSSEVIFHLYQIALVIISNNNYPNWRGILVSRDGKLCYVVSLRAVSGMGTGYTFQRSPPQAWITCRAT